MRPLVDRNFWLFPAASVSYADFEKARVLDAMSLDKVEMFCHILVFSINMKPSELMLGLPPAPAGSPFSLGQERSTSD